MLHVAAPLADEDPLLARLRAGEAAAFEILVRREAPRLMGVARRLLRCEEDAREALQDAFVQAFRNLATFRGGCRISTWLHRITVNAALMKLRRKRRKPEEPIEHLLPVFQADGHHACESRPWHAGVEADLSRDEDRAFVRACIDRLPDTYRTVLMLRDIEDFDTAETAALLGVTEGAVKVRLHRARQALRTLLEPRFASDAA